MQGAGGTAVFVDPTGRRSRLVARTCWALGVLGLAYVGLVLVSLLLPPGLSRLTVPGLGAVLPGPAAAPLAGAPGGASAPEVLLGPRRTSPSSAPGARPTAVPAPSPLPSPLPSPRPSPAASRAAVAASPRPGATPAAAPAPGRPSTAPSEASPAQPSPAPSRRASQAPAAPPGGNRSPQPRPSQSRGPR